MTSRQAYWMQRTGLGRNGRRSTCSQRLVSQSSHSTSRTISETAYWQSKDSWRKACKTTTSKTIQSGTPGLTQSRLIKRRSWKNSSKNRPTPIRVNLKTKMLLTMTTRTMQARMTYQIKEAIKALCDCFISESNSSVFSYRTRPLRRQCKDSNHRVKSRGKRRTFGRVNWRRWLPM